MKDFIESVQYDYPATFKLVVWGGSITTLFVVFMLLPPWPILQLFGVTAAQGKVEALYRYSRWQLRAEMHPASDVEMIKSVYGSMLGVDREGRLAISTPEGPKFVQSYVHLADVKVNNVYGVASMIAEMRGEDAKFEFYPNDQVVVWVRGAPFNVKLIEAGHAVPDPNPPTNIVDRAFATYYWRIFNGSENAQ